MRILIADDDLTSRMLLRRHLEREGHEILEATSGHEAWGVLTGPNPPRVVLLDWVLPDLSGVDICRGLREATGLRYVHVILITARDRREDIIAGLEAGADDYITKPVDFHQLRCRLAIIKRLLALETNLEEANAKLREMLLTDHLTRILNRAAIIEVLERELDRARRNASPLMVVMADIDHFKSVNDTRGHLAGDEVLREFAMRLKQACRKYDQLGRYGGEEFLLVIPGVGPDDGRELVERFRQTVSHPPVRHAGADLPLTASFGAYWLVPDEASTTDRVIQQADVLLYQAKRNGRNRVEFEAAEGVPQR